MHSGIKIAIMLCFHTSKVFGMRHTISTSLDVDDTLSIDLHAIAYQTISEQMVDFEYTGNGDISIVLYYLLPRALQLIGLKYLV
jgi:hypothetical protein